MEFTTGKIALSRRRCLFESTLEQPIDSNVTLPEYFPDLVRVLKCTLTPRIHAVQNAADRVSCEGSAQLCVLYLCEEGGMRCFEQSIPFSVHADCPGAQNGCAGARAKCAYVNCRVASPRRMDIHGSITVAFHIYGKEEQALLCDCSGGGVQMRKQHVAASTLAGCTERIFSLGETLELGSAKPSIAQLVRSEAVALLEDVKLVTGKALIKGELVLRTLYIPDGDGKRLERMEHSMPISQIVEIEGAQEGCTADTALTVCGVEVAAKTDASGALRLLDASVSVSAQIALYTDFETDVLLDAYSTQYETRLQQQQVCFQNLCDRVSDTCLCRGTLDTTGVGIAEVLDMHCKDLDCTSCVAEGELRVSGKVTVGLLYIGRDGQIGYSERSFDIAYHHPVAAGSTDMTCETHIAVTGTSFVLGAEDQVDARVELDVSALVFSEASIQILSEVSVDEEQKKRRTAAALTIYFAQAGESVWEIARRYNTTAEAIRRENDLQNEVLDAKCKLLIPSV